MRVSKYLYTACVSENYSQTTESYAQAAARDYTDFEDFILEVC